MHLAVSLMLLFALLITTHIFVLTIKKSERSPRIFYFILLIASAWLYIMGYLFEINSTTDEASFLTHMLMYTGAAFTPSLFLLFAISFIGVKIKKLWVILLLGYSAAAITIVVSSQFHTLYYERFWVEQTTYLYHFNFDPGPLYMPIHIIYYVFGIIAALILVRNLIKSSGYMRWQALFLLLAALMTIIGNLLFALRLHIFQGLNLTPIALSLSVSLLYLAIKRYNFLDVISLASKQALQAMNEAFIILDHDKNVLEANNAAFKIFPELQYFSKNLINLKDVEKWPLKIEQTAPYSKLNYEHNTIDFSLDEGKLKHYRASISEIHEKKLLRGWSILIQDISSTVELMESTIEFMGKLEVLAVTDALTGLYNRRYFTEYFKIRFSECIRKKQPASIILGDIDCFKLINDTYGHAGGDAVLVAFSDVIKKQLRSYDLIARYGGEEFIILLPDTGVERALEIAERLRKAIEKHETNFLSNNIKCTISLGIAVNDGNGDLIEFEKLIDKADVALYHAKENGRNRVEIEC